MECVPLFVCRFFFFLFLLADHCSLSLSVFAQKPFAEAIQMLEKLPTYKNPYDRIQCLVTTSKQIETDLKLMMKDAMSDFLFSFFVILLITFTNF
jgi:hypothetical protein